MIRYKLTDGTIVDVDPAFEQIFLARNPDAVVVTDSNNVMVEDNLDQELAVSISGGEPIINETQTSLDLSSVAKTIQGWAEGEKTKLDLAVENTNLETPFTEKDVSNTTTELQLSQLPRIQELEARLEEIPSMSQEAADILKEIESIKSTVTESRVKPKNKAFQNNINIAQEHENKVMEITDRVLATGGDEKEVNKQIDFYEANNPEQTRVNTAKYEINTINDGIKNISTVFEGDDYSAFDMKGDEVTELNSLVEQQIIEDLSIKDMGRAAENNYTLAEKETIILDAKQKVLNSEYKKAEEILKSASILDFQSKENNLIQRIETMASSVERDANNNLLFKTQQDADAYNALISEYNSLDVQRQNVNNVLLSTQTRLQDIQAELGYNAITGVFANNFETTDQYNEWRDRHVKERGFWGGAYDAIGTFVQEGVNIAADATVGFGVSIAGFAQNKIYGKSKYYDGHDIVQDWYKNYAKYNWTGVSDAGADILDENGDYTINARSFSKTISEMAPFTIGIILAAKKGNFKPAKNMWSTIAPRFLTSDKGRRNLRMMDAAFRMTANDNYHEGIDLGLSDEQAYAYSGMKSWATGISQAIMPDINFLGSASGKIILNTFFNDLKKAATKKGIGIATKNFITNIIKELGEEEVELLLGDISKYAVGLAHSPDILDIRTQKETVAATLMLSGSLGTVGTASDIKNAKNQIYEQYKNNGKDVIDLLDDNLTVAEGKFKRARTQKSKDRHQATIDQINDAKNYGQSIINAINSAPENVSDDQIDLLIQKQNLVKQKQNKDKAAVAGIDEEIKALDEQISQSAIRQREVELTGRIKTTVQEAIKKGDLKGDVTEMTSEEISNIEEKGFDSKTAAKQFGFIAQNTDDGSFNIILNKDKKMVATESHEFLHAILNKTIGGNTEIQNELGDALINHVSNLSGDKSILTKRLSNYGKFQKDGTFVRDDNFGEEVITIMSESIIDGSLKFEENLFTKIGNNIRRFLQKIGVRKIKFNTGRDVYNFVKDYSKNIKEGKIDKVILNVAKEGVEGRLIKGDTTPKATVQMSKDASDNVQRIYEEQGEAGAMDIIDAFKPITSKIVERRSQAPNFDRQLLTDEIETGKRGIFDLIRSYDPNKGVPLAAYINQNLPSRAIEASRRVLGEEFTEDITERVDVAAEEVTTETKAKPKPKKIILADRLNIAKEVDAAVAKILPDLDIDKLTFKNLKNKVPSIVGKLFGIAPKKLITNANITKSELQKSQMFINKNADLLIKMLPEGSTEGGMATGVPKTLLNEFYTKGERAKMAKTGTKAGLPIQQKNNINKKQFLEVFGIVDGKPNRTDRNTSARVLSLANTLGKMITNQAVRQQVQTETFRALEDGKSTFMFSKADLAIAKRFKQEDTYYKIDSKEAAERYVKEDVPKLIKVFEDYPGLLNANELVNGLDINTELKEIIRTELRKIPELQVRGKYPKRELSKWINNFFPKGSRLSTGQLTVEKLKKAGESRINEFNKQSGINFDAHWKAIDKALSKDPTLLGPILIYLGNAQNSRTHIQRSGAEFTAYDKTIKGKVYLEHALQNVKAYRTLIEASMNDKTENRDNFKKAFKALKSNYKLIGVSVADNKKLDDSGYKLEMPKNIDGSDWSIFNNNWWDRYINEKVNSLGGINFENFKVIGSKNNLAQELNIPILKLDIKQGFMLSKAMNNSRVVKDAKGISILDFDDTLATTESLVKYTAPDGKLGALNAEQFASTYEDLQDQGYTFDFSDFNKVVKGKLAPLFNKAIKLQKKFGHENMFVLTARPPQAQKAIFDFLKANGLNIPLKNITGLGNSTSEAKALWVADKVGEGYNDFYFADDALQNVQAVKNMLDQFDVKSKVQQAKIKFSKDMNREFNDILEGSTGVESMKEFSDAQAKIRGARTKYKSIIPASAQDFAGLLYNFLGRSKKGEANMAFFKKALIDPFARGINDLNASKQSAANDYENLQKQYPQIKKIINKKAGELNFTNDQAVRVYLWDKAGFDIPGLSKRDLDSLKKVVNENADLKAFAEGVGIISKEEAGYSAPGDFWLAETITSDLLSDSNIGDKRADFLAEWQQNRDVIFSPQNLNKIEAIYGSKFREALQDILYRMETGRNRPTGSGRLMNTYMNWVNNSVGAIMFFNMRSALLQTISATNFINWSDNNPLKAAAAFANQPQYWKDFAFLFNSDFLKQRRAGNQRGINEAELSSAVAGAENKAKAAIAWLLKKGFLPTQIADSFAIASGGATFYRNRVKKYIKEELTQQQAEEKAFLDFQETSEVAQQSARPDMISQQQASPLGRLILAFQNTPMQYARIINKASRDLVNGRGDYKTHISKIAYYGVVQSIIFGALQSALFAALGEDDEEQYDKKKERILNGALDSILSGIGYGGKAISTVKNTAMTYLKERDKGFRADHTYTILSLLSFSPPIGSKLRKIYSSIQTEKFNKDVFKRRGFSLDNPIWSGIGNVVEGFTNIPLGRLSNKMLNIDNALDANNELWQRIALVLGWNTWDLGIKDPDIEVVKSEIKEEKKQESKKQAVQKAEEKKKEKEEKQRSIVEENKKKKDGRCAAVSSSGKRCKNKAIKGSFCTIHEETKKLEGGKKVQCRKRKADGTRCKMQTSNKSKYCYYHD